jgi:hypothetical protein
MQIGEENAAQKVGRERGFNATNITFTKLRVNIFNKPYFYLKLFQIQQPRNIPQRILLFKVILG